MQTVRDSWTDDRLDTLNGHVADGFAGVDRRFELVDQRFELVDQRFEQIDKRFEQIDRRFELVDQRFEQVDGRFVRIEGRLERMDGKLDTIQHAIIYGFVGMTAATVAGFAAIMGLMATQI